MTFLGAGPAAGLLKNKIKMTSPPRLLRHNLGGGAHMAAILVVIMVALFQGWVLGEA